MSKGYSMGYHAVRAIRGARGLPKRRKRRRKMLRTMLHDSLQRHAQPHVARSPAAKPSLSHACQWPPPLPTLSGPAFSRHVAQPPHRPPHRRRPSSGSNRSRRWLRGGGARRLRGAAAAGRTAARTMDGPPVRPQPAPRMARSRPRRRGRAPR
eukprot:3134250-Alexandrium_andersonii.AAC.1